MVRYRSNQNIKRKLEQNQLTLTRANLKTKPVLKLKRKLIVYKKDNKFYIDHAAAYALKLTNVRAIMTENPHLVEVGLETLYKFQNREDIEIEYQELNKSKKIETQKDDLTDTLEKLGQREYGIGIHGIDKGNYEERQSTASNISNEGLNINNNSKTILSTSISLGMNENEHQLSQDIMGYNFEKGTKVNVVIAVPLYIQSENGEKIFLGFPEENKRTSGQQYEEHCILDRICTKLKRVPPEFILGYYCENPDGSENFIKNLKHYSNIPQEKRENFYKEISLNMDDVSKRYNELIASGNIEKLVQIKNRIQQLGLNSYMVDNAMILAQKYKEQTSKDTGEKKVRQVMLDNVQNVETPSTATKSSRTRKILLDICKGTKLSDLSIAKETLREGMEVQEKDYEGKEV